MSSQLQLLESGAAWDEEHNNNYEKNTSGKVS